MDERIKFFVGLDAHKDSIAIAACEPGVSRHGLSARWSGRERVAQAAGQGRRPAQVSVVYEPAPRATGCIGSCAGAAIEARSWRHR